MKTNKALAITLVAVSLGFVGTGQAADRLVSPRHASQLNAEQRIQREVGSFEIEKNTEFRSPRSLALQKDFTKAEGLCCEPTVDTTSRPLYTGKNPFQDARPNFEIAPVK